MIFNSVLIVIWCRVFDVVIFYSLIQIEPLTLKGIPKPVVCYEYVGNTPPLNEHERLDAGTTVIEKYLKRCITDVFDSHKFLNGRIMGLQVQPLTDNQSAESGFNGVGVTSNKSSVGSPINGSKKKSKKLKGNGSRSSSNGIMEKKRKQSTESISFLSTKREYTIIDTSKSRPAANQSASNVKQLPPVKMSINQTDTSRELTKGKNLMEFSADWSGFLIIKGGSGSGEFPRDLIYFLKF
jgi:hypothetical protein